MAYVVTGATNTAYGRMLSSISTLNDAKRSNPDKGVGEFLVVKAMVAGVTDALSNTAIGTVVKDQVGGVAGGGASILPISLFFSTPPSVFSSAAMGQLGWTGQDAFTWTNAFVDSISQTFKDMASVVYAPPIAGFGSGAGVLGPQLFPGLSGSLYGAALASFLSDGRFSVDDNGGSLTPEIMTTLDGLCTGIANSLNTLMAVTSYTPGAVGTAAYSGPGAVGTFR